MKYKEIDKILEEWSKTKGLFIGFKYKDEDVRSMTVVDNEGFSYQLSIEPSKVKWKILVYSQWQKTILMTISSLPEEVLEKLEEAYLVIVSDIKLNGRNRTIY